VIQRTIWTFAAACVVSSGLSLSPAVALAGESRLDSATRSLDGQIAYVTASGFGEQRRFKLFVADADGAVSRAVAASSEPLMSPAWSPDGRRLAYVGYDRGNSAIYVYDLQTRIARQVVRERGVNGSPAWSPDGGSLAMSLSFGVNADIYLVNLASGLRRRLTEHRAIDTEPAWSPDGSQIAFTSDREGGPQIYIADLVSGAARRVTRSGRRSMDASWCPDGRSLALVEYRGSRSQIALLDLQNLALHTISDGPMDESPSFSPDGSAVIYTRVQSSELAVTSIDGTLLQRLPQRDEVHGVAWASAISAPQAAAVAVGTEAGGAAVFKSGPRASATP
jgi:TolB protein